MLQSTARGIQVMMGIIGRDGMQKFIRIIVAIVHPINNPTQRQHSGKTKELIFGARSARKLQSGTLPKFCLKFLKCII